MYKRQVFYIDEFVGFTKQEYALIGKLLRVAKQINVTAVSYTHLKELAKLKPKIMRIYPVLVIKNTKLAQDYENGEYRPLSVEQAVERCKELYYFFNKKRIQVIRIGLQNTDTITNPANPKSDVLAGPYHDAFGQLVEASMWLSLIHIYSYLSESTYANYFW